MNKQFVENFMSSKDILKDKLDKHPNSYLDLVTLFVEVVCSKRLDPKRIHEIDDGDYQGCLVYVIAEKGYQPSSYWYLKVEYGSCSHCDTLQGTCDYDNGSPSEKQKEE